MVRRILAEVITRLHLIHRWKVWPRLGSIALFLAKHLRL